MGSVAIYQHSALQALMWLRFIDQFCPSAQYIIKMDDDVVGNIFALLQYLKKRVDTVSLLDSQMCIFCRVIRHRAVERRKTRKWYVTMEELPDKYYLNYCVGMAMVFTGDLPRTLLQAAQNERYFWIDDYFISGILAKKADAHLMDWKRKVIVDSEAGEKELIDGNIFFRLMSNMSQGQQLWERIQQEYFRRQLNESLQSTTISWHDHYYI
ncbi:unnamed protein product [Gongylonema pulchrum]|uniref:Hexosyltransferase n=1 Tax=Gongylonema pulchrum TaxID=637853 RepID=A0A183D2S1_9BILA|nr:unnamed protein product [Gongylonema pulchrum]